MSLVQNVLPKNVRCVFVAAARSARSGPCEVLCAKPVVVNEPFGVILPDDLIWNECWRERAQADGRSGGVQNSGVIAVEEVPREQTNKYGIVDATRIGTIVPRC